MKTLLLAALLGLSCTANAAFIETDWKTQGDQLAVLDTETGLEWLDLSQTANKTFNQVLAGLNGAYSGWRLPTLTELQRLMGNYFSDQNVYARKVPGSDPQTRSTFERWVAELGKTGSTHNYALGMYQTETGTLRVTGVYRPVAGGAPELYGLGFSSSYNPNMMYSPQDTGKEIWGTFLVSDGGTTLTSINQPELNINNPAAPVNQVTNDVPVPAGVACVGLLLLWCRRARNAL